MTIEDKEELSKIVSRFAKVSEDGKIETEPILNPQELAKNVWQKIWISTGKEPEKCLYNVVEIFIFKFLSDLDILQGLMSFDALFEQAVNDKNNALQLYASLIRPKIRDTRWRN